MQRLESISRAPNSPRHRKMLFPPIEVNNKSTGLLARTLGTSGSYPEKRSNLDGEGRGTNYVLTGADVFAPPPPKTYRRLIGTPPPRPLRNAVSRQSKSEGETVTESGSGNYPSIRVQNFGNEKDSDKPYHRNSKSLGQMDETNNSPFVPMYSSDFRFNRPLKMSTTELNDDSDEDDDNGRDHGLQHTSPVKSRLQPPPRITTWKSDGALMNDIMVQEWRAKEWDPTPAKESALSLSADFAAIKNKMQNNRMKSNNNTSVKLMPLKVPLAQHDVTDNTQGNKSP